MVVVGGDVVVVRSKRHLIKTTVIGAARAAPL